MLDRKRIDLEFGEPFEFVCDGRKFKFTECYKFAEIANMSAGIWDSVLKTMDKSFIRLTVVSEEAEINPYGVHKGWYSVYSISPESAVKIRQSWAILREQPNNPSGPWAD